jgi:hypothetical protein
MNTFSTKKVTGGTKLVNILSDEMLRHLKINRMKKLRDQLISYLNEENAHASLETALKDLPDNLIGVKHPLLPYSIWQLTEHIRITQWDIVEFSRKDGQHDSPEWPTGYWPKSNLPPDLTTWAQTLRSIKSDRKKLIKLMEDPEKDLLKPFTHGQGQTLFREAMLIIDHSSYHIGEIIVVRRLLKAW